jgi:hypothetical protein
MLLPCSCHVLGMILPCSCHDIAMLLPCSCYVLARFLENKNAIPLPCHCHIMPLSIPCPWHVPATLLPRHCHALAMSRMLPSCLDASMSTHIHRNAETHLRVPDLRIGALLWVAIFPLTTALRHIKLNSVVCCMPSPCDMLLPWYVLPSSCHVRAMLLLPCSCHVIAMFLP